MLKRIALTLACVAAILAVYQCAVVTKSRTSTKCSVNENFRLLENCCNSSPGDIVGFKELRGCNSMRGRSNFKIMNSFEINKADTGNRSFNLDTKRGRMRLDTGPICYAECAFKNLSLLSSDTEMDYTAIETYFTKKVSGIKDWTATIATAYTECQTFTSAVENKTITTSNFRKCLVLPAIYMQCLVSKILTGCPSGKFKTSKACKNRLANFNNCNYFNSTSD
ncbi:uncharacterized protein LOC135945645 [Cloeon dipterum]|uniref:uncharacterized protein LOC135945645 n=1 Tax=Cloeon dipterum TaxID=197152 RepID=UPI0032206CE4